MVDMEKRLKRENRSTKDSRAQISIFLSPEPWDGLPTNKHQLARKLNEQEEVVYVDLNGAMPLDLLRGRKKFLTRATADAPAILVVPRLPVRLTRRYHFLLYGSMVLANIVIAAYLRCTHRSPNRVFLYFPPVVNGLFWRTADTQVLYHCVDQFQSFPEWSVNIKPGLDEDEKRTLLLSDVVVATSPALAAQCRQMRPDAHYLGNVADVEVFSLACENGPIDTRIAGLESPVLVFHGNLVGHKIDLKLLVNVQRRLTAGTVVVVGPVSDSEAEREIAELVVCGGFWIPSTPQRDLVPILRGASFLLLPYILTGHTANVFPLKLMEYLATGKPIVSTRLPAIVEQAGSVVHFVDSAEGVIQYCESPAPVQRYDAASDRQALAVGNDWSDRLRSLVELLDAARNRKKAQASQGSL
ncbi:glycosyltransferase [Rhodococcus fascians]|nr:glycosyltransferase [Rhodococcus fascians]MBY4113883.1 glycosyltransferase [Rhodococcus fascians]